MEVLTKLPDRILVVDDEPDILNLARIVLEKNRHQAVTASNGEEALQMVNAMSPDLIFLDILLPKEDGLHLAQKIKGDFPNSRIAMLTNYDLSENRRMAAKFGVDRFFIKDSLNWEEIKEWVAFILDNPGKK